MKRHAAPIIAAVLLLPILYVGNIGILNLMMLGCVATVLAFGLTLMAVLWTKRK